MTVLIDPPLWPAHGTLWSHLVSDRSLAELHDFADAAGLPRRGFDLDHYDVPAERFADLVARGAVAVPGRELVRRLTASGLRVPGRDRRGAKRDALAAGWDALVPGAAQVGAELLDRWHEPHRVYHSAEHLADVLRTVTIAAQDGPVPRTVRLALWFHDAVHDGVAGQDEEASAGLARDRLDGILAPADVAEVARLVLLTAHHAPDPDDEPGALMCDADLAILGSAPDRYDRYVRRVRAEYAHVSEPEFRRGRADVLRSLASRGRLFTTAEGSRRWERAARANLGRELTALSR